MEDGFVVRCWRPAPGPPGGHRRGRRLPRHRGRRLHHRPDPARRRRVDPWLTSGSCVTAPTKVTAPATTPRTKPPSRRKAASRYAAPYPSLGASPRSSPAPSPAPVRPPPSSRTSRACRSWPPPASSPNGAPRASSSAAPPRPTPPGLPRLASPPPRQPLPTLRRRREPHRPPHPRPPLRRLPPPHRPRPRPPPRCVAHTPLGRPHPTPRRPRCLHHRRENPLEVRRALPAHHLCAVITRTPFSFRQPAAHHRPAAGSSAASPRASNPAAPRRRVDGGHYPRQPLPHSAGSAIRRWRAGTRHAFMRTCLPLSP